MSTPLQKSSQIICRAVGFQPSGVEAVKEGVCAMCGAHIAVGDLQAPFSVSPGFVDDLYLAARGSQVICGWCVPCIGKDGLMETGKGVYSGSERLPFHKWADIAKALISPPAPPFVMAYATAKNQHMAWRSVVNYSQEQYYVRVGLRDLKIRRQALLGALDDCILLGNALQRYQQEKKPTQKKPPVAKTHPHPFFNLSPDLKAVDHATFKPSVFALVASEPELQPALDRLMNLTLGETWGLRFILAVAEE